MLTQTASTGSQSLVSQSISWEEALQEFLLHRQAIYATKTVRCYRIQLTELVRWAEAENVAFAEFGTGVLTDLEYLFDQASPRRKKKFASCH